MCGTPPRPTSPAGGSILVTMAPRSRNVLVQCGPASTRVKSMTRSPSSGAFISIPLEDGRARAGGDERGEAALLVLARPHQVVDLGLLGIRAGDAMPHRQVRKRLDAAQRNGRPGSELASPRPR